MQLLTAEFYKAKNLLEKSKKIVIISHRNPDGDTVGANLALRYAFKYQWNKEVISACVDPPPRSSDFLPEWSSYAVDFDLLWPDVMISVDVGGKSMLKFHETKPDFFSGEPPLINIDHHASNDHFGAINIVDTEAASATQVVYYFLKFCGIHINRQIATCLLHGLYFDTGSFMHSNTTPEVLEVAADLMWKGADFRTIAKRQFHTMPVHQLKLYGKALERARVNSKKITVSALTSQDFAEVGAAPDDTTGVIDYLNSVPDGNFCCLVHEDKNAAIKGSFRTRVETIDLSKLAGVFGGGGHKKAAGFSFPARLREINPRIKIDDA